MNILVTGFEPFGGADINPSASLVEALRGRTGIRAEVLPTAFDAGAARLLALMDEHRPSLVLMFGVHGEAARPRLEKLAINFDHAEIADNGGEWRQSQSIDLAGPLALETPLDLIALQADLKARGCITDISHHAGTYVCNHTYYRALQELAARGAATPCLFVHIPTFKEKPDEELQSLVRLADHLIDLLNPSL